MKIARPPVPFDEELAGTLAELQQTVPATLTAQDVEVMRAIQPSLRDQAFDALMAGRPLTHTERTIPGPAGAPDLVISIFKRIEHKPGGPGIYQTHGGGMVLGNRFTTMEFILDWVELVDAVAISVEYRLAPEHPDPAIVEDCYAGLVWTADHAPELGFDAARLLIAGTSAGGGIAAGVTLLARDRGGPPLIAQVLVCPMIDDRAATISSNQFDGMGIWDGKSNEMGWQALLGDRYQTDQVSIYAAPARATDLSNLPPAFIDVGSAEVFRDEAVAYASKIWMCGGQAELHVWSGGFHGFHQLVPQSAVAIAANTTRTKWLQRMLGV